MTEYAKLVVAVDSTQVTKAGKEIDKLPGKAGKAEQSAGKMSKAFLKLGGVLAAALSVREVMQAADAYTNITNRLRLVTDGAEGLAKAQTDLFNIAQRSRQPLSETAELYQRIAQNQAELKLNSDDVARITETISKSLAVSGASAASAAGAMTQLGQAFASGQLRGEELNSVLENAPALAQALARGLGVTVGKLRALGQEGKLTAMNVVDALQQQAGSIDSAFSKLEPTISGALITVNNAFTQLVGKMDETSGASSGLAKSIMDVAELLQDPKTVEGLADLASGLATLAGWMIKAASATATFFDELTDGLAGIRHLSEVQRMEEEIHSLQVTLNNLTADLMSPDWMLSIRGLDRGQLETQAKSLKLMIKGLKGTLAQMKEEEALAGVSAGIDSVLAKLGGFTGEVEAAKGAIINLGDGGKAAKKLASAFASMRGNLAEQVALYRSIGETAKVRYEIESGSLRGLAKQKQDEIMGLARELDLKHDLTEQEQRRIDILRESGQLRAANDAQFELEYAAKIAEYEKQGNQEALQRLETLKRIREIQMNADRAPGTVEGVSRAPGSGWLDAAVGGAGSELIRLQLEAQELETWRAVELEKQKAFLEAKAINEETHAERVANIHQQAADAVMRIQGSQTLAAMAMAQGLSNDLMSLMHQAGQENTAFYKAMFLAQKGMAVAQAIISTELAAVSALAPPPLGLGPVAGAPYAGMIRGLGYASVAMIGAQTAVGMASFEGGGYTGNGPRSGGLDGKGGFMAMVHPKETITDHTKQKAGGAGGSPVIQLNTSVTVEAGSGTEETDGRQIGQQVAGMTEALIMSRIEKESRPGGLLWNLYGGGR